MNPSERSNPQVKPKFPRLKRTLAKRKAPREWALMPDQSMKPKAKQ